MNLPVETFSLKDAPALIEKLLPVQKLSVEAYREQMAVQGKTLTALGSYWKGRKPLILNKACVLGCLLPATGNEKRDLEIFEMLMAMDDASFVVRWPRRPKPKEILGTLAIARIAEYFIVEPEGALPVSAPVDWSDPAYEDVIVRWRDDLSELDRRRIEAQLLPKLCYRQMVEKAKRPEEVAETVHDHIWNVVNAHLGTSAESFPELVEQLGIMRYGHRPRVADTFCGSGQIPFEAARLGCDVYASDLNPIACMLTWGAFNVVGGAEKDRKTLADEQKELIRSVHAEIDRFGIEADGSGWHAKAFLYCFEARCPQTGWMVPLLPTRIVSKGHHAAVELIPDAANRRYGILVRTGLTKLELAAAKEGTIRTNGRGQDPYLTHTVDGKDYRTKISTLRGDYRKDDGSPGNRLRLWGRLDFKPRPDDIFQERLYCVQWVRAKKRLKGDEYEFRAATPDDLDRERVVEAFISKHLAEWQANGWVPDMRIESGYNTDQPIRERGWTYWHHLFNPRELLIAGLMNQFSGARLKLGMAQVLNSSSRLSRWSLGDGDGRSGGVKGTFDNQALNTLFNYGARGSRFAVDLVKLRLKSYPFHPHLSLKIGNHPTTELVEKSDVFVTDPPYGDAVKYEEILDFFVAWLRKNPPPEFADWIWDSRRSLAIQGEGEGFRRGMVAAYSRMTECMPDNGIQVIMFTHQSGSIWADMANIVWASGLQVTAAWYVVTETESALRQGSNVKGTVLLVVRKRSVKHKTTRDDLAWEIKDEVEAQVRDLSGLNQEAKGLYRDENVFEDADIQMAGYAAALRVLTRYAVIDGRDMTVEAGRPRIKGEKTFVDEMIDFSVDTANQCLVPEGIPKAHWYTLSGPERFYLKLLELEAKHLNTLDNYQNFAKAFKVRDFRPMMASVKANEARLKSAIEFGKSEMSESSMFNQSALRAVLYALMELAKDVDGSEVLAHLTLNVPDYYSNQKQRDLVVEFAGYLAKKLETSRPEEASAARVLRELVKNQRLG